MINYSHERNLTFYAAHSVDHAHGLITLKFLSTPLICLFLHVWDNSKLPTNISRLL